jgi:hypothetical protein
MKSTHKTGRWLAAFVLTAMVPAAGADNPIALHPENHRYFLWKGRATVLVASGEHYGAVVNQDFDYRKYLATLEHGGLNHTRLFLGDYVEGPGSFGIVDNPLAPAEGRLLAPWARSTTPGFARGGNKFDLDRWDPRYFERLHAYLDEAERRGIVVEAVLFFVGPGYDYTPFNPKNNVNGTTPIDLKRYLSLDSGNVLARQEAYCRKLVREMNRHPNVILNLCNEPWFYNQEKPGFASQPPAEAKAWIRRVSEWVADEESRLPARHLMSVDITNQGSLIPETELQQYFSHLSVFNVHYDANAEILRANPNIDRLLAFNETGFNGIADDNYRTQGWNFLLSGGGLYGNLDFSFTVGHEDGTATPRFTGNYNCGGSPALRAQLRILLEFVRSLPLERMRPDNSVVVGGADFWSALAGPGQAYAVWFPGDGPIAPLIAVPPGEWRAEWVDILTGAVTRESFTQKSWISTLHGVRRGGGVALRVLPAAGAAAQEKTARERVEAALRDISKTTKEAFARDVAALGPDGGGAGKSGFAELIDSLAAGLAGKKVRADIATNLAGDIETVLDPRNATGRQIRSAVSDFTSQMKLGGVESGAADEIGANLRRLMPESAAAPSVDAPAHQYRFRMDAAPKIDRSVPVEDFESGDDIWKTWYQPRWSTGIAAVYDSVNKAGGRRGLMISNSGPITKISGMAKIPHPFQNIEGMNALRMWVKPYGMDGTKGSLATGFIDGSGEIWQVDVPDAIAGTEPYILQIRLEDFRRVLRRNNGRIDLENQDFAIWMAGEYKFTLDDVMFVHDPAVPEFRPERIQ